MAVNNPNLDVKFWDLGLGWLLNSTQPLILDLNRQKHAKTPLRFRFSKVTTVWISTCNHDCLRKVGGIHHDSWYQNKCRNWPHFAVNHPFNIVTELNFFQNQNINCPCLEAEGNDGFRVLKWRNNRLNLDHDPVQCYTVLTKVRTQRRLLIACAVRCAVWFCFVSQFTSQCNVWGEKFWMKRINAFTCSLISYN